MESQNRPKLDYLQKKQIYGINNKYGCRCKASIVKRRGQVIYELVSEPDV